MITIALRYNEKNAPKEGTIELHNRVIEEKGAVWFGKLGSPLSWSLIAKLTQKDLRIVMLQSGDEDIRYWAYVSEIQYKCPPVDLIPDYYKASRYSCTTWFKIVKFEQMTDEEIERCKIARNKKSMQKSVRHSSRPYFVIEY